MTLTFATWCAVPFLRKLLHGLMLQLIDALYLLLGQKRIVLLVVLLAQVENLLTALHALFDGLLGFGIGLRILVVLLQSRSECPNLFLVIKPGGEELLCGLLVKR